MAARIDERLTYDGFGPGYPAGACRLRVYDGSLLPVAVVTELDDNPGASVTNAAEQVHAAVARRLGLPDGAFWHVEHYPPLGTARKAGTYDLVTIEDDGEADWVHLPADRVEALIGELPS